MNSFFLTLPSDSSMCMFPNNNQCCFKIHLPKTIHINKEEWEVALVQLITPVQFLNISEEEAQFDLITTDISEEEAQFDLITTDSLLIKTVTPVDREEDNIQISPIRRNEQGRPDKWAIRFTFPAGSYSSSKQAINVIDQLISDTIDKALNKRQADFSISYSVVNKPPKINFNNVVRIGLKLHPALFLKLGGTPSLKDETIFQGKNMRKIFKYNPNINAGYNHLYIYSDVAEHNIVGDTLALYFVFYRSNQAIQLKIIMIVSISIMKLRFHITSPFQSLISILLAFK